MFSNNPIKASFSNNICTVPIQTRTTQIENRFFLIETQVMNGFRKIIDVQNLIIIRFVMALKSYFPSKLHHILYENNFHEA